MPPPEGRGIAKRAGRSAGHTRGQAGDGAPAVGLATDFVGPGIQVVRANCQASNVERGLVALGATLGDLRLREIDHRDCVAGGNDLHGRDLRGARPHVELAVLLAHVAGGGGLDELRQALLLQLVSGLNGRRVLDLQTDRAERRGDAHRLTGACRFRPVVAAEGVATTGPYLGCHLIRVLSGDAIHMLALGKVGNVQHGAGAFFQPSIRVHDGDPGVLVDGEVVHRKLGSRRRKDGGRSGVVGQLGCDGDTSRHANGGEAGGDDDRQTVFAHESSPVTEIP